VPKFFSIKTIIWQIFSSFSKGRRKKPFSRSLLFVIVYGRNRNQATPVACN
jgi:hypothetical protein